MKKFSPRIAALLPLLLAAMHMASAQQLGNPNAGRTNGNTNNNNNGGNRQGGNGVGGAGGGANTAASTRTYRNNTQLGDALIQIDPETRSLIIVADDDTHNEMMKVIKNLDRPKPQVLIKVLFAQVTLDNTFDFGVEGNYAFDINKPATSQLVTAAAQQAVSTAAGAIIPTPTNGRAASGSNFGLAPLANQSSGAFFTLNTQNATATLYALATKGKVNVLSRPSILARNNQEAVIVVGQEVPIPTGNTIADTGATTQTVSYQDVGIILRVTPFITVNKSVEMIVSPEISSLSTQTVAISNNFNAPVINLTRAETVVVTPDSKTVVIGGLMSKTESTQVSKVPWLGDIPVVGNAFKRTTKSLEKNELVIFLTPYIIEGTDHLQELGLDDVNRSDIPQEGFTPKDVNQFLDNNVSLFPENPPRALPVQQTTTRKATTTTTATTTRRATPSKVNR